MASKTTEVESQALPSIAHEIESLSAYGKARCSVVGTPLPPDAVRKIDAYWRACNYLSLGMIYLQDNPLLYQPLQPEHIKNRLLGHWGTSPGLSFVYVHLNRLIKKYDLNMIFLAGPGHGAPGVLGPVYLEGRYSEIYSDKSEDTAGLREFFRQFSFPGGIGSHCTPETPGSIHEGGELGYVLSHACGAAFDNPDLIVAAVVGDGESETGPLATSWHINKFLNPIRDGAVLPVLHLNGYKINNPTLLARISHEELDNLLRGYGWTPYFVEGSDPESMHQAMAATLEECVSEIREYQQKARRSGAAHRPRWPMVVLRSPKGWTAPAEVGGHKLEGSWRAHQVPLPAAKKDAGQLELLEKWMREMKPQELFDGDGRLIPELKELAPEGTRRMSANPRANGGLLRKALRMPDFHAYSLKVDKPGQIEAENTRPLGTFLRDVMKENMDRFRVFGPDENTSNKLQDIYEASKKFWIAEYFPEDADGTELAPDGRVIEMLSEHTVEGMLPADGAPWLPLVIRGVRPCD
jgi:xylulose-5-phosphate/fructose-6-phosphate phosphoketolase